LKAALRFNETTDSGIHVIGVVADNLLLKKLNILTIVQVIREAFSAIGIPQD
jgi:hypothetical protein